MRVGFNLVLDGSMTGLAQRDAYRTSARLVLAAAIADKVIGQRQGEGLGHTSACLVWLREHSLALPVELPGFALVNRRSVYFGQVDVVVAELYVRNEGELERSADGEGAFVDGDLEGAVEVEEGKAILDPASAVACQFPYVPDGQSLVSVEFTHGLSFFEWREVLAYQVFSEGPAFQRSLGLQDPGGYRAVFEKLAGLKPPASRYEAECSVCALLHDDSLEEAKVLDRVCKLLDVVGVKFMPKGGSFQEDLLDVHVLFHRRLISCAGGGLPV